MPIIDHGYINLIYCCILLCLFFILMLFRKQPFLVEKWLYYIWASLEFPFVVASYCSEQHPMLKNIMMFIMTISLSIHMVLALVFTLSLSLCSHTQPGQKCKIVVRIATFFNFRYGRMALGTVYEQPMRHPIWLFLFHGISLFIMTSWNVLVISTTVDDYLLVSQQPDVKMFWVIHSTIMVLLTAVMIKQCLLTYLCSKKHQAFLKENGVTQAQLGGQLVNQMTNQLTNQHFMSQQLSYSQPF